MRSLRKSGKCRTSCHSAARGNPGFDAWRRDFIRAAARGMTSRWGSIGCGSCCGPRKSHPEN